MEPQLQSQTQSQIIYVVQQKPEKPDLRETYSTRTATLLGGLHIFCGAVALIADIVGILHDNLPFSTGIWTSVFFFLSGGLAIGGAKSGNRCLVVATMVMSIISAVSAGVLLIMSSIFLAIPYRIHPVGEAAGVLQIVMGLVMLAAAIASSALTCRPMCCGPGPTSAGAVHYNPGQLAAGGGENRLERAGLPSLRLEGSVLPSLRLEGSVLPSHRLEGSALPSHRLEMPNLAADLEKELQPGQGSAWDGTKYQHF